jgi:nitric oxide reductase subunit B
MQYKGLWTALALVIIGSFAVLGAVGYHALENAPPIPARVLVDGGTPLFSRDTIQSGQNVWQSLGGQQLGSIFGHGAYVAPDWTADWLHRESLFILNEWARTEGVTDFDMLPSDRQAGLKARLQELMRTNTYNPAQDTVTIDPVRARAFDDLATYYTRIFSEGQPDYAIPQGALTDPAKARQMSAFFWWTAWVSSTNRAGSEVSYTQNWPHEPLVANTPTGETVVWSVISFVLLLAGIGGMV